MIVFYMKMELDSTEEKETTFGSQYHVCIYCIQAAGNKMPVNVGPGTFLFEAKLNWNFEID